MEVNMIPINQPHQRWRLAGWSVVAVGFVLIALGTAYDFWHLDQTGRLVDEAIAEGRLDVPAYQGPLPDWARDADGIVGLILVLTGAVFLAIAHRRATKSSAA